MNVKRIVLTALAALLVFTGFATTPYSDSTQLTPKPTYGKEASIAAIILEANHYRKLSLNDSLSSVIFDSYISKFDNNKTFFLKSDIESLEHLRYQLDDFTKQKDVSPAYTIYNLFRKRFTERMNYVMTNLVNREFDYTVDEYYEVSRDSVPWASTVDELNEVWRKIVKSQALNLKLAGQEPEAIKTRLSQRFERMIKTMSQYRTDDVFEAYLTSIAEAYDPHSNYFQPQAAETFHQNMSQSLEGIGARLQTESDYTKVIEVLPGGPAEKSNILHAGDRIIGVAQGDDGEMVDVIGLRIDDVVKLIKGPKGTVVQLLILPAETGLAGPTKVIRLVRDKIRLEDQRAKKEVIDLERNGKNYKFGVIKLPSFYMDFEAAQKGDPNYSSTTRDVKRLIEELNVQQIDGLILDLQDNGGGSLREAIDLAGLFIKKGPVVQVRDSREIIEVAEDEDPSITYNGPMVVLTNRFSASASEIVAGALQDYHRAVIVGEPTYGKGTVQTLVDLDRYVGSTAGELKLTFQKFYRVTGSSTQHRGVNPDIVLPSAFDANLFGESSTKNALPWDEIRSANFEATKFVTDRMLNELRSNYERRLSEDLLLKKLAEQARERREGYREKAVSLNEQKRRWEIEEHDRKVASLDRIDKTPGGHAIQITFEPGKTSTKSTESVETAEVDEVTPSPDLDSGYLREGLIILSDMVGMQK